MTLKRFEAGKSLESQLTETRLNAMVDAINANQLQQGFGIRISRNGGGSTISAVTSRVALDIRPFTPYLKSEEEGFYQIRVSDGYLYELKIPGDQAFIEYTPDGIKDGDEPIWHDIQLGQSLYCTANVDSTGRILDNPVIEVLDDDVEGAHYKPEIGEYSGASGTHRYKLCKLKEDGTIEMHRSGNNLEHVAERGVMRNLSGAGGAVYNVLKDYEPEEDVVNFRPIVQKDTDGVTAIDEASADSILFKRHKGIGGTDEQLKVTDDGGAIQYRGNSYDAIITSGKSVSVTVKDGFVTALSAAEIDDGWWGTTRWEHFTNIGDTVPYDALEKDFEAGILKEVRYQAPGGSLTVVTGTEASPGTATFTSFAEP